MSQKPLDKNQLKVIAVVLMALDHLITFYPASPLYTPIVFLSRLTAPIMAFCAAEGFRLTRNRPRYLLRMALFAAISWLPFYYFEKGRLPTDFSYQSVLYTLLLGLLAIWLWEAPALKGEGRTARSLLILCKAALTLGILYLSNAGDWRYWNVLFCMVFYFFRDDEPKLWAAFTAVALLYCMGVCPVTKQLIWAPRWGFSPARLGTLMALPFLKAFYNGQRGSRTALTTWGFYLFYPAHLLLLGLIYR